MSSAACKLYEEYKEYKTKRTTSRTRDRAGRGRWPNTYGTHATLSCDHQAGIVSCMDGATPV